MRSIIARAVLSWFIVAWGQPAVSPILSILASCCGYALFFSLLLEIPQVKKRFWMGTLWFAAVQAVQLYWLLSHPYIYIYGLYLVLCSAIGMQFGLLSCWITQERLQYWRFLFAAAGFFTLMEWLRLFVFTGFSFNPVGLAMTGTLWGLQNAALFGVYGLTFFIILLNLMLVRFFYIKSSFRGAVALLTVTIAPYLFGYFHVEWHRPELKKAASSPETVLNTLLVQTAFPIEETLPFASFEEAVRYVMGEWKEILMILEKNKERKLDLIVLPEYVVPYGTYMAVFPYEDIELLFLNIMGIKGDLLPKLQEPLALELKEGKWHVTNAYICQAIADLFEADLIVGLQDDQWKSESERESYSSAFYFWPGGALGLRYEKRVLLPMAEYIPFEFCKKMAADYGITGSFHFGKEAKVFPGIKAPFGLSVCYEETFGDLMRESRIKGAELLVNVTSDIWYPNSRLPKQHFDHARLRTVEAGVPLVRACNTGITAALTSLGEVVAATDEKEEWVRQGLYAKVPLYHYQTLYARVGDLFIILGSLFACLGFKRTCPLIRL